jgi:hypothetical protein
MCGVSVSKPRAEEISASKEFITVRESSWSSTSITIDSLLKIVGTSTLSDASAPSAPDATLDGQGEIGVNAESFAVQVSRGLWRGP